LYKHLINQYDSTGKSVSVINIDKAAAKNCLQLLLNDVPETIYYAIFYENTNRCHHKLHYYNNFFARLIFQLFPDSGVILVDAHNKALRELESSNFSLLIKHQPEITDYVYHTLQIMQQHGYPAPLDSDSNNANIFYHEDDGSRIL